MKKRFFCDALILLSLVFLPWYISLVLGLVFVILFTNYWEGLLLGFFMDAIFSIKTDSFFRFGLFTMIFSVLIFSAEKIRTMIRF